MPTNYTTTVPVAEHDEVKTEGMACVVCGCTDQDCTGCVERTGQPCTWAEAGLCSACAPLVAAVRVAAGVRVVDPPLPEHQVRLDLDAVRTRIDYARQVAAAGTTITATHVAADQDRVDLLDELDALLRLRTQDEVLARAYVATLAAQVALAHRTQTDLDSARVELERLTDDSRQAADHHNQVRAQLDHEQIHLADVRAEIARMHDSWERTQARLTQERDTARTERDALQGRLDQVAEHLPQVAAVLSDPALLAPIHTVVDGSGPRTLRVTWTTECLRDAATRIGAFARDLAARHGTVTTRAYGGPDEGVIALGKGRVYLTWRDLAVLADTAAAVLGQLDDATEYATTTAYTAEYVATLDVDMARAECVRLAGLVDQLTVDQRVTAQQLAQAIRRAL